MVPGAPTEGGALLPALAIAAPDRQAYSQTFVHQHLLGLPFDIHHLHGGNLPTHHSRGPQDKAHAFPGENADPWIRVQAIATYLTEHRVAAVLAEFGPTGVEMMPACLAAGVPLLVHFHGYDAWRRDVLDSYGQRYGALFQQAHALIGVSREMCTQLQALGAPPHKVHHLVCGIDPQRFAVCEPARNAADFIMVGRQVDKKGHLLALPAFAEVMKADLACRLRIIGDGPLRQAGEMLARILGIGDRVRWLGVLPPAAVARELQASRALVQFSHTTPSGDREGTPVAVLEAMCCGLPVIGSRHAGIADVIENEVTGLLVEPWDLPGLTSALRRLAQDRVLVGRLGQAAAALVRRRYTADLHLKQLAALIRTAIQTAKG